MDSKAANAWLMKYYDKVITGIVLSVLLLSVIYLGVKLGAMERTRAAEKKKIESLEIKFPELPAVDVVPYEEALARLVTSSRVDTSKWTHALFVPVERVYCPACTKASLTTSDMCSLCGVELPKGAPVSSDRDGDGMADAWELEYGLNPESDQDATLDADADEFDNLTEHDGQSNPSDATSMPELDQFLTVHDLIPNKFNLKFEGKVTYPGGIVKYLLNTRGGKSHLKKIGEVVEGFKLVDYKEVIQTNGMKKVDVSVLKLQRGDRIISLTKNRSRQHQDYTVVLGLSLDPAWQGKGTTGNTIAVTWKSLTSKYKIKEIDSRNRIVVLGRLRDGKDVEIEGESVPEPAVEKGSTPVPGDSDK